MTKEVAVVLVINPWLNSSPDANNIFTKSKRSFNSFSAFLNSNVMILSSLIELFKYIFQLATKLDYKRHYVQKKYSYVAKLAAWFYCTIWNNW